MLRRQHADIEIGSRKRMNPGVRFGTHVLQRNNQLSSPCAVIPEGCDIGPLVRRSNHHHTPDPFCQQRKMRNCGSQKQSPHTVSNHVKFFRSKSLQKSGKFTPMGIHGTDPGRIIVTEAIESMPPEMMRNRKHDMRSHEQAVDQ